MDNDNPAPDSKPAAPVPRQPGPAGQLDAMLKLLFGNRIMWLAGGMALYFILQLSHIQYQSARDVGTLRFEMFELMAILLLIVELGMVAAMLIQLSAFSRTREAWYQHLPNVRFNHIAWGIASQLIVCLLASILLVPLLFLHTYPELVEAAGIRVPMMVLQRLLIISGILFVAYNIALILRYVLRFPSWLAGMCGIILHFLMGLGVTYLSHSDKTYERLGDVFFYNQLWKYLSGFPNLQNANMFHNIQMPWLAYYVGALVVAWILTLALWAPAASIRTQRETPPEDTPDTLPNG